MPNAEPPRILIVDDEAAHTHALCDTLREQGYDPAGFTAGAAALAALHERKFDLLLADLMMPEMDGITLLRAARAADPDLIGIIMTGQGTIATAVEAMKTGAFDYILKPFKLSMILPVLARALAVRQLRMEKVELERRLRERTAELEAANKGLEAFAATVSHDLRNPLGAIDAMTKLIVENFGERIPAEAVELLQSVNTEARQTLQLIDDLLRFARLGRQPLSKQPVDVTALVRDVLAELRLVHADRSVALRVGELPNCIGDPALLKQVLLNLLSNAYKFTGRKDVAIVEVEGRRDDNELVFLIRDNGAGFDMRYADGLFGVFQRLHGKSKFEGTGVGLSIVRSIVERHGGRVWAEGEVDKGATFYFSIPRTD
jgi:hypothetical protein